MAYVYKDVESLIDQPTVDNSQCVRLLQVKMAEIGVPLPHTSLWRQGAPVWGNLSLRKGTCIATFEDGKYQSNAAGNHAAFYLGQDAAGIDMVEQYSGAAAIHRAKRVLRLPAEYCGVQRIDNVNAYFVIEQLHLVEPVVYDKLFRNAPGMGGLDVPVFRRKPSGN